MICNQVNNVNMSISMKGGLISLEYLDTNTEKIEGFYKLIMLLMQLYILYVKIATLLNFT